MFLQIKFTSVTSNFTLLLWKRRHSLSKVIHRLGLTRRVRFYLLFTSVILSQEFRERLDSSSLSLFLSAFPIPYGHTFLATLFTHCTLQCWYPRFYHVPLRMQSWYALEVKSVCSEYYFLIRANFKMEVIFWRAGACRNQWENGIWGNW